MRGIALAGLCMSDGARLVPVLDCVPSMAHVIEVERRALRGMVEAQVAWR